jgi:hypothetical protein
MRVGKGRNAHFYKVAVPFALARAILKKHSFFELKGSGGNESDVEYDVVTVRVCGRIQSVFSIRPPADVGFQALTAEIENLLSSAQKTELPPRAGASEIDLFAEDDRL